jgi:26S proteasome regulatory subunit T3
MLPFGSNGPLFSCVQPAPAAAGGEEDLYVKLKKAQRALELLEIQEEYVKDEMRNLKRELVRAQEEVKRIQSVPLTIGTFLEMIDEHHGIVTSTAGSNYYVRVLSTLDREKLKPNSSVALHRHAHSVVDILPPEADSTIQAMAVTEKPDVSYDDIGGLDIQKQEIREAVELPLSNPELYTQVGIDPPRGVLMFGPPGECARGERRARVSGKGCPASSQLAAQALSRDALPSRATMLPCGGPDLCCLAALQARARP